MDDRAEVLRRNIAQRKNVARQYRLAGKVGLAKFYEKRVGELQAELTALEMRMGTSLVPQ
jgi:uncharacterized protein YqeY